jgi:error-prone DNA polymerase
MGFTLGRHPLALLRPHLPKMQFIAARDIAKFSDRQLCRACGLVTVRQRPMTANSVVFLTLEDETGTVNVVVWPDLVQEFRKEVMGGAMLGVFGQWQFKNNVGHLVAKRFVDLSHLLGKLETTSRDFH